MRTLAIALVLIVASPHLASAERYCAYYGRQQLGDWPFVHYRTYCARWRYRDDYRDETRVYGYERRYEREEDERPAVSECLFRYPPIRATGDDKLAVEKARISAQDRWSIEVETMRGTRFSDIHNAMRMTASCVEKVPTTDTEKGQASILGLRHYVCSVEAVPCTSPKLPIEPDEIAKRRAEQIGRKEDPRADYYEPEKPRKRFLERWRRARQ
jgi:hypothetical protein